MYYVSRYNFPSVSFIRKILEKFAKHMSVSGEDRFNVNDTVVSYKYIAKGGEGYVYFVEFSKNKKKYSFAVKYKINSDSSNEVYYIKLGSMLVLDKFVPNFLLYYTSKTVDDKLLIAVEKADGDLNNWLETYHTDKEWYSFLFQITAGVVALQQHNVQHRDLKPKNILYSKLEDKQKYFSYTVNKTEFFIEHTGYLFYISDFGHSVKVDKVDNSDMYHIKTLYNRIVVSYLEKKYKFVQLINMVPNTDTQFKKYMKTEKIRIKKELEKYPQNIVNKMIKRSIAYYIVEKNYYKIDLKDSKLKLPSTNIKQLIDSMFSTEEPLGDTLVKYHHIFSTGKPDKDTVLDSFYI